MAATSARPKFVYSQKKLQSSPSDPQMHKTEHLLSFYRSKRRCLALWDTCKASRWSMRAEAVIRWLKCT